MQTPMRSASILIKTFSLACRIKIIPFTRNKVNNMKDKVNNRKDSALQTNVLSSTALLWFLEQTCRRYYLMFYYFQKIKTNCNFGHNYANLHWHPYMATQSKSI